MKYEYYGKTVTDPVKLAAQIARNCGDMPGTMSETSANVEQAERTATEILRITPVTAEEEPQILVVNDSKTLGDRHIVTRHDSQGREILKVTRYLDDEDAAPIAARGYADQFAPEVLLDNPLFLVCDELKHNVQHELERPDFTLEKARARLEYFVKEAYEAVHAYYEAHPTAVLAD